MLTLVYELTLLSSTCGNYNDALPNAKAYFNIHEKIASSNVVTGAQGVAINGSRIIIAVHLVPNRTLGCRACRIFQGLSHQLLVTFDVLQGLLDH